eukprot:jgi/Botrbrau1/13179/Bobra.242_1s0012.1
MSLSIALLQSLGKELKCPVCLETFATPTARLPCCHNFCRRCLEVALNECKCCPVCKTAATKRSLARDTKLDSIVELYLTLQKVAGHSERGPARGNGMLYAGENKETTESKSFDGQEWMRMSSAALQSSQSPPKPAISHSVALDSMGEGFCVPLAMEPNIGYFHL